MELRIDLGGPAAVGVEHLGRDALREHVLGALEPLGGGVRVDVDEAGRDVQAGRVDDRPRLLSRQRADPRDVAADDADVGHEAGLPGAVDDRAAADDHVEGRTRCGLGVGDGRGDSHGDKQPSGAAMSDEA